MTILTLPDVQELDPRTNATELVRLFRLAEEKIKLVENLNHALSIPAINELRYAGFHMAQYLAGENAEQLSKAENHCKRAIYDAVEAGVTHQLEVIAEFQNEFRVLIISETVPGYSEIHKQIIAARDLILTPREPEERAGFYEKCSDHLETLRAAQVQLDIHREDLLKALKRQNKQTYGYWVGVGSFVVCAIAMVFAILAYYKPDQAAVPPAIAAAQVESSAGSTVAAPVGVPSARNTR